MQMRTLKRERLAARARHAVYGSVIVLAVVIALDDTDVGPRSVVESVLAAAIATVLAEVYADHLAGMIREARVPTSRERMETARNATAGLVAAVLPVIFFVLAWIGVLGIDAAFTAATWTGVGVVGSYAFLASRISGSTLGRSIAAGIGFTILGAILVLLKALAAH